MSHAGGEGCKKHDAEPFDLGVKDQRWFWTDAMFVARSVGYVIHHRVEFEQSAKDLEDLKTGIVARLRETKRLAYPVFELAATGFSTLCDDRHAIDPH